MQQYSEIPDICPNTPLLNSISSPTDIRLLSSKSLDQLADELRHYLLYSVGLSGGHFGAGLGVVELTIALHYCFKTPSDNLIWDVGHQAYPHKVLTGRKNKLPSIRSQNGLAAFPDRQESPFDAFGTGHSSTSISACLGMALNNRINKVKNKNIAIIGDGALSAGLAYEALNHAASEKANLLVILNDNDMSISSNVGGIRNYLAKLLTSQAYTRSRDEAGKLLNPLPNLKKIAKRTEGHIKGMISQSTLFEEIGFNYTGPIDGHDLKSLVSVLKNIQSFDGPQFLHVITRKGCGYKPAHRDPISYHAITKIPSKFSIRQKKNLTYSNIFGRWLVDMAFQDINLIGITPAMCEGSDLREFAKVFPERFFDVAICEQHAVCMAAGMAAAGSKPVVAIYSTFLQRAYDQVVHDVCAQRLDVTFAIDRAGLVGEDGPTHAGVYDLAFLRTLPNIIIACPSSENDCRSLLTSCYEHPGPSACRYPRGCGPGILPNEELNKIPIGKAEQKRSGKSGIAILAFGSMVFIALEVAKSIDASLWDMRWVKPLDGQAILEASKANLLVTIEEHSRMGGAGSAVTEWLTDKGILANVLCLALPDRFEPHGTVNEMLTRVGLNTNDIETSILNRCKNIT